MEILKRDVISYITRLVEERLANDPDRLNTFRNLELYFENNRNCTNLERTQKICQMLGEQNQDLYQVYFPAVQEKYEAALRVIPPLARATKLIRLAKIAYCIQFLDLYRQHFSIQTTFYTVLSNAVKQFIVDQITDSQLNAHLSQVSRLEFPDFHNELEARVNRITSLFRGAAAINSSL